MYIYIYFFLIVAISVVSVIVSQLATKTFGLDRVLNHKA